jgi:hypothetical protein
MKRYIVASGSPSHRRPERKVEAAEKALEAFLEKTGAVDDPSLNREALLAEWVKPGGEGRLRRLLDSQVD